MEATLERLTGRGHAGAAALRAKVAEIALAERVESGRQPIPSSVDDYLAELSRRTVCMTLLAGAGSRWRKSLEASAAASRRYDASRPRGLFPVRNRLAPGGGELPIAAYAIAATRGLGRRLIVVRGWEREIDEELLAPMGVTPADRSFFEQSAPFGKPLGHGDAAWQSRALWSDADYVIANFGGDAGSRVTVLASLLALDALNASGSRVDLLIPAARFDAPAYPIRMDEEGLPRGFGHAKLQGVSAASGPGYANVGVRLYRASALLEKVESFRSRFWVEGSGYAIPGNDPEGHEFALDNVDAELAAEGRARVLAIASPDELTPAKSLEDIPAFEDAVARVVASDAAPV